MSDKYFIKKGYIANKPLKKKESEVYWTNNRLAREHLNPQFYVYKFCRRLIKKEGLKSVLDIGCGNAAKLMKLIYPICKDVHGIDESRVIEYNKKKYGINTFYSDNIENSSLKLERKFDLIICSDIIEHLETPDLLVTYIKRFSHTKTYIVISTPERDILRGKDNFSSPNNSHVREWNLREFQKYLISKNLKIVSHNIIMAFRIHSEGKISKSIRKKILLKRIKTLKKMNKLKKLKYNQLVVVKFEKSDEKLMKSIKNLLYGPKDYIRDVIVYLKIKYYNFLWIIFRFCSSIKVFFILVNYLKTISGFKNFLLSIRAFVENFLKFKKPLSIFKKRLNGISVLLPTQNEELLIELSILSFKDFADELIVVDNGSIDNTKDIVRKLAIKNPKIKFFDKPEISELYQNRQFALRKSKYRWICRFDSDYIAYTDGENDILKLRKFLLSLPRSLIPKAIELSKVNIDGDFWHVRKDKFSKRGEVIRGPEIRIYEYFPFFTFSKFGRREYGSFQNFMKKINRNEIYYMHCSIKSDLNLFLRSERSNWRQSGNYRKYPTLVDYIKEIIKEKYNTIDFKKAMEIFLKNKIYNKEMYIKYDTEKYQPYPSLIIKEMKNLDVYRLPF